MIDYYLNCNSCLIFGKDYNSYFTCVVVSWWFWCIDIHTFWTVQLHHSLTGYIWKSNWKHGLIFTIDSWTMSEISGLILLYHLKYYAMMNIFVNFNLCLFIVISIVISFWMYLCYTAIGEYVSCMYKTIQHFCCLFNEIRLIWVIF